MAQTTTSTTVHHIIKYSSSKTSLPAQVVTGEVPWKHHAGEQLRLTLDVTTRPGATTRYVMKVSYLSDDEPSETQASQGQNAVPEVVLEKLDLSSFSEIRYSGRELPLKAVYKNSTIAFRYLFPQIQSDSGVQTYRRFQMTFKSELDALEFIKSIQLVCPCDKSKPSALPPPQSSQVQPQQVSKTAYRKSTMFADPLSSSSLGYERTSSPVPGGESQVPRTFEEAGMFDTPTVPRTYISVPSSSSVPSPLSSQPVQGPNRQDPPPVIEEGPILSALRQGDSELYKLSFEELQQVVAEVIREPGFPELVGRVHKMWKEQAVLDLQLGLGQR